jgi:hypothetical protein
LIFLIYSEQLARTKKRDEHFKFQFASAQQTRKLSFITTIYKIFHARIKLPRWKVSIVKFENDDSECIAIETEISKFKNLDLTLMAPFS